MSDEEFQKVTKSVRPSMRQPMATVEQPRDAAARIAELRNHNKTDSGHNEYFVEPGIVPEEWSYEWKRWTVLGAEDPSHQTYLQGNGWEIVPASRHPEMMPLGYTGTMIIRKGMVLMERPLEITEEARSIEQRRARLQVRAKEEQLSASRPGEFERSHKGENMTRIKKGYEAMPIPE